VKISTSSAESSKKNSTGNQSRDKKKLKKKVSQTHKYNSACYIYAAKIVRIMYKK